jgi:hypothetical protein
MASLRKAWPSADHYTYIWSFGQVSHRGAMTRARPEGRSTGVEIYCSTGSPYSAWEGSRSRKVRVKVVPSPSWLCTLIWPRCILTMP